MSPNLGQAPLQTAVSTLGAQPSPPPQPDHIRNLMYALQAADAMNTQDFLRRPGTFETDPMMKPFAHAGNPLPMLGAYGLEDLLMNMLTRHSAKARKDAELSQIMMNAGGLLKTNAQAAHDNVNPQKP